MKKGDSIISTSTVECVLSKFLTFSKLADDTCLSKNRTKAPRNCVFLCNIIFCVIFSWAWVIRGPNIRLGDMFVEELFLKHLSKRKKLDTIRFRDIIIGRIFFYFGFVISECVFIFLLGRTRNFNIGSNFSYVFDNIERTIRWKEP